jgi:hypothetical protein
MYVATASASAQPAPLQAPRAVSPYRVAGSVADRDGNPIASVEVTLIVNDSAARFVLSDQHGRFELTGLTTPTLLLRVRRLGYQPQVLTVQVTKPGRTANVDITMEPSVTSLNPVVIDDHAPARERPNPRLVGFNERVAKNSFGHYVTEEMLAKLRPQHASDALRTVPGVVVRQVSGRIGNIVRLRGCGVKGMSSDRVGPLVWVDGVRLPGAEIDEITQGMDIAGIEVYNSFAGIPAQYLDRTAVCGTILVWTKNR